MSEEKPRCKQKIWDRGGWHSHRCFRGTWKDGYCKQHHPESVIKREKDRTARYEAKKKASLPYRYQEAMEKIQALEQDKVSIGYQLDKALREVKEIQKTLDSRIDRVRNLEISLDEAMKDIENLTHTIKILYTYRDKELIARCLGLDAAVGKVMDEVESSIKRGLLG